MKNNFFSRLYGKAKKIEMMNHSLNDIDGYEYIQSKMEKSTKNNINKIKEPPNAEIFNDQLIVKRETLKKDELLFDIFMLKIKDLKSLYDKNKYYYIVSMIITYTETNNKIQEKWGIEDIKTTISHSYKYSLKDYEKLRKLIINNTIQYI